MMKLKCIGGPFDGKYEDFHNRLIIGDAWQIREYPKTVVFEFDPSKVPELITAKIHIYKLDVMCYKTRKGQTKRFEFLAYENTDMDDVILSVFKRVLM